MVSVTLADLNPPATQPVPSLTLHCRPHGLHIAPPSAPPGAGTSAHTALLSCSAIDFLLSLPSPS